MDLVAIPGAVLILSTLSIWIFPCYSVMVGRLHHRVSRQVKNNEIRHLANICWLGGVFFCYAEAWFGKTSFRFFVKWQMARIDWLKRVYGYFEKMQIFPRFPVVEGMCF